MRTAPCPPYRQSVPLCRDTVVSLVGPSVGLRNVESSEPLADGADALAPAEAQISRRLFERDGANPHTRSHWSGRRVHATFRRAGYVVADCGGAGAGLSMSRSAS